MNDETILDFINAGKALKYNELIKKIGKLKVNEKRDPELNERMAVGSGGNGSSKCNNIYNRLLMGRNLRAQVMLEYAFLAIQFDTPQDRRLFLEQYVL